MAGTKAPPHYKERVSAPAAGHIAPIGPSEVEQGFRQQFNSQHYNIVNGGDRLLGELNSDQLRAERQRAAFERPVGRKQHPTVDPSDRGPSGTRQSFDIITGLPRAKERW